MSWSKKHGTTRAPNPAHEVRSSVELILPSKEELSSTVAICSRVSGLGWRYSGELFAIGLWVVGSRDRM